MKKFVITIAVAFFILASGTLALAKSQQESAAEMDASLVLATAPASGFDSTLGITVGAGMMLPHIDKNLQGRIDISYFKWSASEFGVDVSYTRIPILASGRYFIPTGDNKMKVYAQGGLELSFDKAEAAVTVPFFGTVKSSASDTNLGLVAGAGLELKINPQMSFVTDIRWHLITDGYFTLQGGLAFHI